MVPQAADPVFLSAFLSGYLVDSTNGSRTSTIFTVDDLEKRLRPGETSRVDHGWSDFSREGFLGPDGNLVCQVIEDWKEIEKYGCSHQEIADALRKLIRKSKACHPDYSYERAILISATQSCPWGCLEAGGISGVLYKKGITEYDRLFGAIPGMKAGRDGMPLRIKNYKPGQSVKKRDYAVITDLLPHLIERHYFFEGSDRFYRADPALVMRALQLGNAAMKH